MPTPRTPTVVYDRGHGCKYSSIKTQGRIVTATSLPCEVNARRKNILGSINSATTTEAAAAVEYRKDAGERKGVRCFL